MNSEEETRRIIEDPQLKYTKTQTRIIKQSMSSKLIINVLSTAWNYVHSLLWIATASYFALRTGIFKIILHPVGVNRVFYGFTLFFMSFAIFLILYISIFQGTVQNIPDDEWDFRLPLGIPIATIALILGCVTATISFWPIWKWGSPLLLFTVAWGGVMSANIIPNFKWASLLQILLYVAFVIYAIYFY